MRPATPRATGLSLAFLGVLSLSPDALLVRLTRAAGWDLLLYRGLLEGLALTVGLVVWYRGRLMAQIRRCGREALYSALILTVVAVSFVMALKYTNAANVLVIIAVSPLIAALIGRWWDGESTSVPTWTSMFVAFV